MGTSQPACQGSGSALSILPFQRSSSNNFPLCSSLYEVRFLEAPCVHPLAHRHEASQPRAPGEHDVVPGSDSKDELNVPGVPFARETKTEASETQGANGEEDC